MKIHELKTDPMYFDAVMYEIKTVEIRRDDRDFEIGDILVLRRTELTGRQMRSFGSPCTYSGRYIIAKITHIQNDIGLEFGWVALSIDVLTIGDW